MGTASVQKGAGTATFGLIYSQTTTENILPSHMDATGNVRLTEADAARVSFPDREITDFVVGEQSLAFAADGIFVEDLGLVERPCQVEVKTGSKIDARIYDNIDWSEASGPLPGFRLICEWIVEGDDLKLAGFNDRSGEWMEMVVPRFSATITA